MLSGVTSPGTVSLGNTSPRTLRNCDGYLSVQGNLRRGRGGWIAAPCGCWYLSKKAYYFGTRISQNRPAPVTSARVLDHEFAHVKIREDPISRDDGGSACKRSCW